MYIGINILYEMTYVLETCREYWVSPYLIQAGKTRTYSSWICPVLKWIFNHNNAAGTEYDLRPWAEWSFCAGYEARYVNAGIYVKVYATHEYCRQSLDEEDMSVLCLTLMDRGSTHAEMTHWMNETL